MWTRARSNANDLTQLSTQQLCQLTARLKQLEDGLGERVADRERALERAAGKGARLAHDLVRKRLGWLLKKQRKRRQAAEAELDARFYGAGRRTLHRQVEDVAGAGVP
jgi:hypothetical protein